MSVLQVELLNKYFDVREEVNRQQIAAQHALSFLFA